MNRALIPDSEFQNLIDIYWMMLREIEVRELDDQIVNSAYNAIFRCGLGDTEK